MAGKYYIAVDCEGVACGVRLDEAESLRFARGQATREAAAAARALFDAGADEVVVWDAHGSGVNLDYEALDPRCRILLGAGHRGRFVGIDETWTAVLFIGYHAMEGTRNAVLSHTMSSTTYQSFAVNGSPVGEVAIDAAYAGAHGVPVLFLAADDKCVREARALLGDVSAVETKKSLSRTSAVSLHPAAACDAIYAAVLRAAKEGPRVGPVDFGSPVTVAIRFQRTDQAASAPLADRDGKPFAFRDAFTREGVLNSVTDLF